MILISIHPNKLGIIMDLKAVNDETKLIDATTEALEQIKEI